MNELQKTSIEALRLTLEIPFDWCNSTTYVYNKDHCVEEADLLKTAITDLRGLPDRRSWKASETAQMRSAWLTD